MGSGSSQVDEKKDVKWVESQGMQAEPGMEREDSPHPYNMYSPSPIILVDPTPLPEPPKTSSTTISYRPTTEERLLLKDQCVLCRSKPSQMYCTDCAVQMCQDCRSHHEDANLLKKHRLITYEDYKLQRATIDQYVKSLICHVHAGNELTYYCNTCSIPICMVCAEYNHTKPRHQHLTLIAGRERKKGEIQEALKASESKKRDWLTLRTKVIDERQKSSEKGQVTVGLIKDHTDQLTNRLHQMIIQLQMHGENLTKQVVQMQQKNTRMLDDMTSEINKHLTKMEYEMEKTRVMVTSSNEIGFLLSVNKYIARLKLETSKDITVDAPVTYEFVPNEVIIESMPINVVGKVVTGSNNSGNGYTKNFPGRSSRADESSRSSSSSRQSGQNFRPDTTHSNNNNYMVTAPQTNGFNLNEEEQKIMEAGLRPNTMMSVTSNGRPASKASSVGKSRPGTNVSARSKSKAGSRPGTVTSNQGDTAPPTDNTAKVETSDDW